MTRTVLAEDQLIFSEALTALLADAEEIKIVKCVENGQVLLDYLKTNKVDLVLMDLKMPVLNGIEATNILKKNYPSIKVLVLSFTLMPQMLCVPWMRVQMATYQKIPISLRY